MDGFGLNMLFSPFFSFVFRIEARTNLLKNLKPDVLGPVRSDRAQQESLQLEVPENHVLVQAHTSVRRGLTVGIPCVRQVIQTTLQGKLEVGARKS